MLEGCAPPDPDAGRKRRRSRRLALVSLAALAIMGVAASAAQAEATAGNGILTCKTITITYSGFPNLPNNKVTEKVRIDGVSWAVEKTFVFNGPEATDKIEINLGPGTHAIDVFAKWNTNGVTGGRDQFLGKITCVTPEPGIAAEKLQKFSTKQKYVKELLKLGKPGQIVDYEIIVRNTGNEPLETINFSDPHCDPGTITGGPSGPLPRFGSTTYFCTHTLTVADREAGIYCNVANVEGIPTEGPVVTAESNTVCVELPNPGNNVEFGCKVINDYLSGFPNLPGNEVKIKVRIDGVTVLETTFIFNGPTAVFTYEVNLPPGHHSVDVFTKWNTHGFKGGTDRTLAHGITCFPEPNFTIEKLQTIEGSNQPFTPNELIAGNGQTVDYEIIVTNTGNQPLKFSNFSDPKCDEGTLAGGPGEEAVPPAKPSIPPGKSTWTCRHTITPLDVIAGEYTNTATVTGTPTEPPEEGRIKESNTVRVIVPQ